MFFISEHFRRLQHKQEEPKRLTFKSVIPVPDAHPHMKGLATLTSVMVALMILGANLDSHASWIPYIILSLIFFIVLNAIGRRIFN